MKQTKLFLLTIIIISLSLGLTAQPPSSKGALGLTLSGFGYNDTYLKKGIEGLGGYDGKGYFSAGVSYIRPVLSFVDFETGVEYSKMKYRFSNSSLGPENKPYDLENSLVTIPVTVRLNFLRYLFLNTGVLLDIDSKNNNDFENQSGLGSILGFGAKYDFKNNPFGVFVNYYSKSHSIMSLNIFGNNLRTRTFETGFRFGIVYRL